MKLNITYSILGICLLVAFSTGCGKNEPDVISIPDPYVTVIGLDGEKRSIQSAELYDPQTGRPAVQSVLAIDRESNRREFVDLDQLSAEAQMDARYILVTDDSADPDPPESDHR